MGFLKDGSSSEGHCHFMRCIVIGDSNSGKTCLLSRIENNKFDSQMSHTIGVEFGSVIYDSNEHGRIKMQIWDTAGQEVFRSITRSYYRNAAATIIVYDIIIHTLVGRAAINVSIPFPFGI